MVVISQLLTILLSLSKPQWPLLLIVDYVPDTILKSLNTLTFPTLEVMDGVIRFLFYGYGELSLYNGSLHKYAMMLS